MHWMRPELPRPARCVVASLTTKVTAIGRFSDRYPVTRTAAEDRARSLVPNRSANSRRSRFDYNFPDSGH